MKLHKITLGILYALMAGTIASVLFYYMGGEYTQITNTGKVAADYPVPINTDILLGWTYALVGIGIVATVGFAIYSFVLTLINSPKKALSQIGILAGFAALLGVAWAMGGDITEADQSLIDFMVQNEEVGLSPETWLKVTNMYIYAIYLLLGIAIAAIAGFSVVKAIRK